MEICWPYPTSTSKRKTIRYRNNTSICANIEIYPEDDIELFYEQMDDVLKQLKSQYTKIIMWDFNSKVGEGRVENIIGPYGLGKVNERGEKLVE